MIRRVDMLGLLFSRNIYKLEQRQLFRNSFVRYKGTANTLATDEPSAAVSSNAATAESSTTFAKAALSFRYSFSKFQVADTSSAATNSISVPSSAVKTKSKSVPIRPAKTKSKFVPRSAMQVKSSTEFEKAAMFPGDELWDPSWMMGPGEETIRRRMNPTDGEPVVQFYTSWFSASAQQTWIALEESNVNYQWNEINPFHVDKNAPGGYTRNPILQAVQRLRYPEYTKVSRGRPVPIVSHTAPDGHTQRTVVSALPACEYVDSVFGNRSLLPTDPFERARVQNLCNQCTDDIAQSFHRALLARNPKKRRGLISIFMFNCRQLVKDMDATGPFVLGDRFTLADVVLAPIWQRVLWMGGHYMKLTLPDESAFRRLNTWWEATSKRPSVAATLVCQPRLIASFAEESSPHTPSISVVNKATSESPPELSALSDSVVSEATSESPPEETDLFDSVVSEPTSESSIKESVTSDPDVRVSEASSESPPDPFAFVESK